MDTFGFTRKKWQRLSKTTQHRHLIKWLTSIYQKITANRFCEKSIRLFSRQYNEILAWNHMSTFVPPNDDSARAWLEALSDRIHYHRNAAGMHVKDMDLMEKISIGDRPREINPIDIDCHIALDGIRSLFNVGAIFRTCDASGFNSVILGNTKGKEDPKVQKTAMGAAEWVDQESTDDLFDTLSRKKKDGYTIVGVETLKGAVPYDEMDWRKKTILVLGNEEYGISSHVLPVCDQFVYIPMYGRKNSINVAACAGIICFSVAASLIPRMSCEFK